ncbi:radical SAM protein [Candidatus Kuenenia sp.]|uniref:B12-binding domain-containing radical SAM protein n=1 Tax=Candidatus Kuenenia sp. TaxID=2499824 RepID=UPI0032202559
MSIDEIEFLIKNYGVKEIHFHDDSFLVDPERVNSICKGLIERKIIISWQVSQGVRVLGIKPGMLEMMQKSGMYRVGFPIETASLRTQKFIRKRINLDKALNIIGECNRLGIYTFANFIIGFPYETKEDIEQTSEFIFKSTPDFVKLLICQPLAGSDLYPIYIKEGLLKEDMLSSSGYEKTQYDTLNFTAKELNKMRIEITRKFQKIKLRQLLSINGFKRLILPKVNSIDKICYFFRLIWLSLKNLILRRAFFGV